MVFNAPTKEELGKTQIVTYLTRMVKPMQHIIFDISGAGTQLPGARLQAQRGNGPKQKLDKISSMLMIKFPAGSRGIQLGSPHGIQSELLTAALLRLVRRLPKTRSCLNPPLESSLASTRQALPRGACSVG